MEKHAQHENPSIWNCVGRKALFKVPISPITLQHSPRSDTQNSPTDGDNDEDGRMPTFWESSKGNIGNEYTSPIVESEISILIYDGYRVSLNQRYTNNRIVWLFVCVSLRAIKLNREIPKMKLLHFYTHTQNANKKIR